MTRGMWSWSSARRVFRLPAWAAAVAVAFGVGAIVGPIAVSAQAGSPSQSGQAAGSSGGRFHLGHEPRHYFEEPDTADAVDTGLEAEGFARWVREAVDAEVDPDDVQRLMAAPDGAPPSDEQVEITVGRLLTLAGLPDVPWPTDDDEPAG